MTVTDIVAKVYNDHPLNRFQTEIKTVLWKSQGSFRRNLSITSKILFILWIIEVGVKNLEATQLFVDFSQAFDFVYRGNMYQILIAYCFFKETITAIMILYKKLEQSPDGDNDFFDIVARVFERDTLVQ